MPQYYQQNKREFLDSLSKGLLKKLIDASSRWKHN